MRPRAAAPVDAYPTRRELTDAIDAYVTDRAGKKYRRQVGTLTGCYMAAAGALSALAGSLAPNATVNIGGVPWPANMVAIGAATCVGTIGTMFLDQYKQKRLPNNEKMLVQAYWNTPISMYLGFIAGVVGHNHHLGSALAFSAAAGAACGLLEYALRRDEVGRSQREFDEFRNRIQRASQLTRMANATRQGENPSVERGQEFVQLGKVRVPVASSEVPPS